MKITLENNALEIKSKFKEEIQGFPFDKNDKNYHNCFTITVKNLDTNKSARFKFYGSANDWREQKTTIEGQDLIFALYCLLSDAHSAFENFSGFCSSFGYDEDSRTAERIYKACEKSRFQVERLGFDESALCNSLNFLSENHGC